MRSGLLLSVLLFAACGGSSSNVPALPAAPALNIEVDIKQLIFSWASVPGATHYKLMENPDGHSGFTQVGADISGGAMSTTLPLAVHLHDFENALYFVEACNAQGCNGSSAVNAMDGALDAIGYLKASNSDAADRFGSFVAISADGRTLAISANGESSSANGIDGDQSDNGTTSSGAVYVFRHDGSAWFQEAYLKASNPDMWDQFGTGLALSGDGNTLAVSAIWEQSGVDGIDGDQNDNSVDKAGAIYIFRFDAMNWSQQAYLKASNSEESDLFGWAVSLSSDGNSLAVGARFEDSNAVGVDGDQADNTAFNSGAVYVFAYDGSDWRQEAYIKASNTGQGDEFGFAVTQSADGHTLAVGAWSESGGSIGVDGDQGDSLAGATSGAVYIFRNDGTQWNQQAYIKASNTGRADRFGGSVSLSSDGNRLAVGASLEDSDTNGVNGDQNNDPFESHDAGAVYVYQYNGANWVQEAYIKPSNTGFEDNFGIAVTLNGEGNMLAVGAWAEASPSPGIEGDQIDDSASLAGAVYIFRNDNVQWQQHTYVKASNAEAGDLFGGAVALSANGETLVVGAVGEDSNAVGVDGDQSNNSASVAGASYVY